MTRKDFVAIARAIKDAREASAPQSARAGTASSDINAIREDADRQTHARIFDSLSRSLAQVCASTNPKFDKTKFLTACGVVLP